MTVLAAWLVIAAILLFGLTLHRALVLRLNRGINPSFRDGTDLLLSGVLPGLALVGGLATALGAIHLLRAEIVLPLAAMLMIWRRDDVRAIFGDLRNLGRNGCAGDRQGQSIPAFGLSCIYCLDGGNVGYSAFPGRIS
ncbi:MULTISPECIES: hypothetical protein [unclassified Rhizobium]|uniref:hypothetical protein n=1 Tax=unclassified Rhizobium TaxID=2613769 RepID=UPI001FD9A781|nr:MULTISPECIES: hypothetical protein [unclassified Rhizobium]